MKKLVLVLGIAILFSCEKETVKTTDGTCNCYVERQKISVTYWDSKGNQYGGNWSTIYKSDISKDFCANAYDWKSISRFEREKKVCE